MKNWMVCVCASLYNEEIYNWLFVIRHLSFWHHVWKWILCHVLAAMPVVECLFVDWEWYSRGSENWRLRWLCSLMMTNYEWIWKEFVILLRLLLRKMSSSNCHVKIISVPINAVWSADNELTIQNNIWSLRILNDSYSNSGSVLCIVLLIKQIHFIYILHSFLYNET